MQPIAIEHELVHVWQVYMGFYSCAPGVASGGRGGKRPQLYSGMETSYTSIGGHLWIGIPRTAPYTGIEGDPWNTGDNAMEAMAYYVTLNSIIDDTAKRCKKGGMWQRFKCQQSHLWYFEKYSKRMRNTNPGKYRAAMIKLDKRATELGVSRALGLGT